MTEEADRLNATMPKVPLRQWVLSMPFRLRFLLSKNTKLRRKVVSILNREVMNHLRRVCKAGKKAKGGSVTVPQRFGSSMNLNVHAHGIFFDGVYDGTKFLHAPPPKQEELKALVRRIRDKVLASVAKAGYKLDSTQAQEQEEPEEPDLFDAVRAASIRELVAFSGPSGLRRVKLVGRKDFEPEPPKEGCAAADGFSLHAAVRISADDVEGRERLLRYVLRPPFASERMEQDDRGRIIYRLKRRRRDGATHLLLTPMELMEKLAALVPEAGAHLPSSARQFLGASEGTLRSSRRGSASEGGWCSITAFWPRTRNGASRWRRRARPKSRRPRGAAKGMVARPREKKIGRRC